MASTPRIVAELGRPETPDETAARKAASSRAYRSSQTFRNLIVALVVTLAVVAIIVWGVPRGSMPEQESVDVAAAAQAATSELGRPVVAPATPDGWRANAAQFERGAWIVTFTPDVYADGAGFVRVTQGLEADQQWVTKMLSGYAPTGVVTIDGIEWREYDLPAATSAGISYALETDAGPDTIVVSGPTTASDAALIAAALSDDIHTLREATP